MPTLIFQGGDGSEQRKNVDSELSVGREAGNDVVLGDNGVSRKHCRFFVDESGQVWVEDLGSANGVLVDGERIAEPTPVSDGTEVTIGGAVVKLAPARKPTASVRTPRPTTGKSTALARPEGATPVRRPTRMMAAGESPKRARPIGKPAPPRGDGRPALRGMAGPFAHLQFDLDKPKALVGRVPPADVVIDDDSVSRRHAEVIKIGSRFSVRDLGSANGTFLNGDRVSEAPLTPGDVVRFGVVEMSFSGPGGGKVEASPEAKKKKLILLGVGGAMVLILIVAAVIGGKPPQPAGGAAGGGPGVAEEPQEDVLRLMGKCRAYSDQDSANLDWAQASKICQRVIELDPTMAEARTLVKKAKKEMEMEALLKEANLKASTSQEEEALKLLVQIERGSSVYPRASRKFNEAVDILFKRNKGQCKGDCNAGRFEYGIPACIRALELTCNMPDGPDAETMRFFQNAARQSGRSKEFTCPPEYAKYQTTVQVGTDPNVEVERILRAKYTDVTVHRLLMQYYTQGGAKKVAEQMKNMRSRDPNLRAMLNEIIQSLEVIDGRFTTWQGLVRQNRAQDSLAMVKEAVEAENRFMPPLPPPAQSQMLREMGTQTAKLFFALSRDEINRGRYNLAFKNIHEGYKLDPRNTDIVGVIGQMEREASRLLGSEPGCETYTYAASITRPETAIHKKAVEMMKKEGCPSE